MGKKKSANRKPSKRNDGKQLEHIVEIIEKLGLPSHFKVERNSPVYDDDGDQIAELDILITGTVGSLVCRTLIECRDRPSDGKQGIGWIEQLFARRQRLKVDMIVAVSSSGFAPAAEKYAKQVNIHLRTLQTLTPEDVSGIIPPTAPMLIQEANFTDVRATIVPDGTNMEMLQKLDSLGMAELHLNSFRMDITSKAFLNLTTGESETIHQIWNRVLNARAYNTDLYFGVPFDGAWVEKTVVVNQDIRSMYRSIKGDERGQIDALVFKANVSRRPSKAKLQHVAEYKVDGRKSLVAHYDATGLGEPFQNFTVVLTKFAGEEEKRALTELRSQKRPDE